MTMRTLLNISLFLCIAPTIYASTVGEKPKEDLKPGLYALYQGEGHFEKLPDNQFFQANNGIVQKNYPRPNEIVWWLQDITICAAAAQGIHALLESGTYGWTKPVASLAVLGVEAIIAQLMTKNALPRQRDEYQQNVGLWFAFGIFPGVIS